MSGARARQWWVRIHRYLGLSVGVLFCLTGVTGSLLVFDHAIDEWLNPGLLLTPGDGRTATLQAIVDAAAAARPEYRPTMVSMPRLPGRAYLVHAEAASDSAGGPAVVQIAVSADGPRVLGWRAADGHLMDVIYDLHHTLLLGRNGELVVGFAAIAVVISLGSGLYLWWPGARKLKTALTIKRGAAAVRMLFDIHRTSGFYSAAVLVVVVLTGIYLVFATTLRPLLGGVVELTPSPPALRTPAGEGAPIGLDRAVQEARARFPAGEVKQVFLPRHGRDFYWVAVRRPGEVRRSGALSGVAIDRYDAGILGELDSRRMTPGDAFLAWQFPLHNGEAFGLIGRWLVFVSGWIPAVLLATGVYIWLRKRRARRSARHHRKRGCAA